jgi:hypothetical protein
MPYKVEEKEGGGCKVVNSETGEVKAEHADCADAHRQVRLLEAIEHDSNFHPRED